MSHYALSQCVDEEMKEDQSVLTNIFSDLKFNENYCGFIDVTSLFESFNPLLKHSKSNITKFVLFSDLLQFFEDKIEGMKLILFLYCC